ncbi:vancomycin high temperature exclusion protein, partial [Salmonella enterica subsp. enterica serovar Poona]
RARLSGRVDPKIWHGQHKYLRAGVTIGAESAHGCPSRQ